MLSYPLVQPIALFLLQAAVVFVGVIGLLIALRRRLGAPPVLWGLGALAFILSQAGRSVFLVGLTLLSNALRLDFGAEGNFWSNVVILSFSAGLFEEPARYVVLRLMARERRDWADAVMFGAGHGGIEAILLVGIGSGIVNSMLLLSAPILLSVMPADQARETQQLLDTLRGVGADVILASLIERALAIAIHIGLSVMVMRTLATRRSAWLIVAIVAHGVYNLVGIAAQRWWGVWGAEAVIALCAMTALAAAAWLRARWSLPQSASAENTAL